MILLATYYCRWALEEGLGADALLDAVLTELYVLNRADLFDYDRVFIDLSKESIEDLLPDDTRHFVLRFLDKAKRQPNQRLHLHLVRLMMFFDLAMKCREARRTT